MYYSYGSYLHKFWTCCRKALLNTSVGFNCLHYVWKMYPFQPCSLPCFPRVLHSELTFICNNSHSTKYFLVMKHSSISHRSSLAYFQDNLAATSEQWCMNGINQERTFFRSGENLPLRLGSRRKFARASSESSDTQSVVFRPGTLASSGTDTQADSWDPLQTHWIRVSRDLAGKMHILNTRPRCFLSFSTEQIFISILCAPDAIQGPKDNSV